MSSTALQSTGFQAPFNGWAGGLMRMVRAHISMLVLWDGAESTRSVPRRAQPFAHAHKTNPARAADEGEAPGALPERVANAQT